VKKKTANDVTEISVTELDTAGREQEIARLPGSSEITEAALANARELLGNQARGLRIPRLKSFFRVIGRNA
jgi:DNA repair ATPase RecN